MIPCRPAMTFCSIVGHASFQTADTMGPSISDRSYLDGFAMRSIARVYYIVFSLLADLAQNGPVTCEGSMKTLSLLLALLLQAPNPFTAGKEYRFEKIGDGVYYATATGSMVTGSNNVAIVGSRDVLVVDTGTSPAAARAFIEDLKLVTTKPVRYVVNTHFHYDHTDGNQVYAGKADIIAHDYVKQAIQTLNVLEREPYKTSQLANVPNRIENLKKQIADAKTPQAKADLERQL